MNDEIVQRFKTILDGASADSTTDSLELGKDLLSRDLDRLSSMDPEQLKAENQALLEALRAEGFESPSTASIYRPGTGKFVQRWPFDPDMPMLFPFDQMDHETQFYTLSAAWSGRRADGHRALHAGDVDRAEEIFRECLDRADQMDVDLLRGLSHICLSYVARRRGDADAERRCLQAARDAHAAHLARA